MLYSQISTKMPYHQVTASVRVTAPRVNVVVQPTRAQFVETNKSSSSFKVNSKLHTTQHSIFHLVCRPGSQWWTPCRTDSTLVYYLQ